MGADLRRPGQPAPEGPDLRALGLAPVQPVAGRGDADARRRSQDRGLGQGLVANFARAPKGGDTDQLKAVAAGECGVAIANSYYLARLMRSTKPEDLQVVRCARRGLAEPEELGHARQRVGRRHRQARAEHGRRAVKFLEYLASDSAQALLRRRQQRMAGGARARR